MTCGIYKIVNKVNGKYYLGSASNLKSRWKRHLYCLIHNCHHSIHLQRSWNKHGKENFVLEVVKHVEKDLLKEEEQKYLDKLTPWNNKIGYNISRYAGGGDNISYHPNIDEIREKQRHNTKSRWESKPEEEKEEYRIKMSKEGNPNWRGGVTFYICEICKNEFRTIEPRKTCHKCRCKHLMSGENNPFYGKSHTEETKNKLREKQLGKTHTEATIELISKKSNEFYRSDKGLEFRAKMSERMSGENHFLYGVGHTEESKKKMSETKKNKYKEMSIEEKFDKLLRKSKMVLAENNFYFTAKDASTDFNISYTAMQFRCNSKNGKWDSFRFITVEEAINLKEEIIENIKLRQELSSSQEDHTLLEQNRL